MIDDYLNQRMESIHELCQQHGVAKLYAFGSIVDGRFEAGKSDIDLLVEFISEDQKQTAKALFLLWIGLQNLLACKVDLITSDGVKGKYFKKYMKLYKELIYEERGGVG